MRIPPVERATTGVAGLDDVLGGGLARGRIYLLEGCPGTGKTTIATQFLAAGAAEGETVLYITLSETENELCASSASHGWAMTGIDIFELVPPENLLDEQQQQSLLYSSDLELGETTRRIFEVFERVRPSRVVLDSLSEIRLLAQGPLRYRRQILALKHYFAKQNVTVLLLDDMTTSDSDRTVHSVAHGVVRLEELAPDYGAERRRLRVVKYRGQRYRGGYHDFVIRTGGIEVFPRLVSAEHKSTFVRDQLASGSAEMNALLGGGIERGSSVLILGPAGTGKSLLALTFIVGALSRGEKAAMFAFDEELGLLFARALGLGIDLQAMVDDGGLTVQQVDAAELSPGELSSRVRHCVEVQGARTVVMDSLNGYQASMPEENALILHMHELLQYLNRQGATTFLTVAQHGLVGDMKSPVDVTYLADTVILLRYFEATGRVRRAGVAHDFNNLLTPITGALDIIQRKTPGDDRRTLRLLDGAIQSAERARVLVQRLLGFARKQVLETRAVDIADLVGGMSDLIRSSIGPAIALVVAGDEAQTPALADPNQLELAILNLCINARDAMPDGGTITLAVDRVDLGADHVVGLAAGAYVRLSVTDTGCGMDATTLARAVEPFYSTKEQGRGTGLGLSMVHGLAAQLGGAFELASTVGVGTVARLYLTLAGPECLGTRRSLEAPGAVAMPPLRVLLVDDEDVVRHATTAMLRDMGHSVTESTGGTDALDRLNAGLQPDVMMTDFKMPRMSGDQLAAQVRKQWPDLPVLIVTGYIGDDREVADIPVLAKPFRQSELAVALRDTMQSPT